MGQACGGSRGRLRADSEASGVPVFIAAPSCKRGTNGAAALEPTPVATARPNNGLIGGPGPRAAAPREMGGTAGPFLGDSRETSSRGGATS